MKADGKTRRTATERDKGYSARVDAVVTSPPYSEGEFDTKHGMNGSLSPNLKGRKVWENREKVPMKKGANIATLKHGNASADGACTCKIDGVLDFPSTAGFGWYANMFEKESVAHPAKTGLFLLRYLIENFTRPGDTVLDVLAGTGSTAIMAADLGRNGIAVELEGRFYDWIQENIRTAKAQGVKGELKAIRGDARNLSTLLLGADGIITSPPYMNEEAFADPVFMLKITAEQSARIREGKVKGHYRSPEAEKAYLDRMAGGRARHPDSISKLEKQETYLQAMAKVYRESFAVLKPGGRMILILKDFIRNKRIVLLHEDTLKLCEFVGFRLETHLKSRLPTQSFWRVLYQRKHAKDVPGLDELNFEHILIFVKPKSA